MQVKWIFGCLKISEIFMPNLIYKMMATTEENNKK
jgi:hypothetical protein